MKQESITERKLLEFREIFTITRKSVMGVLHLPLLKTLKVNTVKSSLVPLQLCILESQNRHNPVFSIHTIF